MNIPGILFVIAGAVGLTPLDNQIAWALILVAGIFMLVGIHG